MAQNNSGVERATSLLTSEIRGWPVRVAGAKEDMVGIILVDEEEMWWRKLGRWKLGCWARSPGGRRGAVCGRANHRHCQAFTVILRTVGQA